MAGPNIVLGTIGIAASLVEFSLAFLAYKASKNALLRDLRYFAYGVAILGLGQLLFMGIAGFTGIKSMMLMLALRTPFRAVGVALILYSLISLINKNMAKTVSTAVAVLALVFILGVAYSLLTTKGRDPLFPTLHLIYLTLLPWYVAYLSYDVYKKSGDNSALYVAIALFIFGLSVVSAISLHNALNVSITVATSVATVLEIIGVIVALLAFVTE